ncbi:hypothetical protein [Methylomonas rosea]|uniref:DUF2281 domain-containing protein n=1 Tax=Methylomonas rosea TaxID=2952227 RepID=A0ABT1TU27_9GAMM|nr:hypothetical protein [Methylomonas sp. WSC-7]MCQ8118280.1 hypothetical protein [Methylomonas sp. WSC-7]
MQAIELSAEIDQNRQIHLQLPQSINAKMAKVIVMYEAESPGIGAKPRVFGEHRGLIEMSDDFNDPLPDSFWLGEDT